MWNAAACVSETNQAAASLLDRLPAAKSVALFFGDQNLFDLEEVLAEFILPVTEQSTISLVADLTMDGGFTLSFGWDLRF